MTLKTQLTEDMKQAMRDRDADRLSVLRFLLSEIKNVEIDQGEQDDAGIQKVIARQVKQMKEAASEFAKGDRQDLVQQEEQKIAVLQTYLPEAISDAELEKIVTTAIAEQENPSIQQMGQIMQKVMAKVQGRADGNRVSQMVKAQLSS